MADSTPARTKIFISYSNKNSLYLDELHTHLARLKRQGVLDAWDDTRIAPGAQWRREIKQAITTARVAILLISAEFLASEFVALQEVPPLLEAARQEGAIILPVIFKPCDFEDTELAQFQSVNDPARPLSGMTEYERDQVWVKVLKAVKQALSIQRPPPGEPEPPKAPALVFAPATTQAAAAPAPDIPSPSPARPATRPTQPAPPAKTAEQWMADGQALIDEGHKEEALAAYEQAIMADPRSALAHAQKGYLLGELGRYAEALPVYERAIELAPNSAVAHYNKGLALINLQRYEESLAAYEEALRLKPSDALAHNNKGVALKNLKRYHEALQAYEQAIALQPNKGLFWRNKGDVLKALGKPREAEAAYRQANELGYYWE